MSALHSIADIDCGDRNVCFVPEADILDCTRLSNYAVQRLTVTSPPEALKYAYILALPWLNFAEVYGPFSLSVSLMFWAFLSGLLLLTGARRGEVGIRLRFRRRCCGGIMRLGIRWRRGGRVRTLCAQAETPA